MSIVNEFVWLFVKELRKGKVVSMDDGGHKGLCYCICLIIAFEWYLRVEELASSWDFQLEDLVYGNGVYGSSF